MPKPMAINLLNDIYRLLLARCYCFVRICLKCCSQEWTMLLSIDIVVGTDIIFKLFRSK